MHHPLAALVIVEIMLFALTMALALSSSLKVVGEYVGIAFHLLLMPLIFVVPASLPGQAAGLFWVGCDVVMSVATIWQSRDRPKFASQYVPVRMAGHLFAAVWIVSASIHAGMGTLVVGSLLGLGFALYTLAGGRLPEKALAPTGLLVVAWLALIAHQLW